MKDDDLRSDREEERNGQTLDIIELVTGQLLELDCGAKERQEQGRYSGSVLSCWWAEQPVTGGSRDDGIKTHFLQDL